MIHLVDHGKRKKGKETDQQDGRYKPHRPHRIRLLSTIAHIADVVSLSFCTDILVYLIHRITYNCTHHTHMHLYP